MSWNKTNSKSLEEKVARLKSANQELREQLKAKDEEIERLQKEICSTCSGYQPIAKINPSATPPKKC